MTHPDESLSTRDLASTPAEDPDRTTDGPAEPGEVTADSPRDDRPADAGDEPAGEDAALLPEAQGAEFQGRWEAIQTTFVDDPRDAVEKADALVAEVMQRLADGFAHERERLEGQWSRGEDVSTEDLRMVLQRYRSFFRRLLAA